jgi:F420-dependent oxidoreductase-like protein
MKITVGIGEYAGPSSSPEELAEQAVQVESMGFDTVWLPQIFGVDALAIFAYLATRAERVRLGTAVIPIQPRHPVVMAQQALTVQAISSGRLRLGIGLSHKPVIETMMGISFEKPYKQMSEYLSVLVSLVEKGNCSFRGEFYSVNASVAVPGAGPFPILVAALGKKMLQLAGRMAAGTITWMTGRKAIETHVSPTIRSAAAEAGRKEPEIVVGLPVALTEDIDEAKQRAARVLAVYPTLPSYKAMLEIEGASSAADILVCGDEKAIESTLRSYFEAGATEIMAVPLAVGATKEDKIESVSRTIEYLASLLAS